MYKGEFFGDQALLYNTKRTATITALSDVICLSLSRDALTEALGNNLEKILYRNSLRISLETSAELKILTDTQMSTLIDQIDVKTFAEG
jgi:cGMP-dependent protein kinase